MYRYLCILAACALTGCQTQYEPLVREAGEARILPVGMTSYYESSLAPTLESECQGCHLSDDSLDTGLALSQPLTLASNFEALLLANLNQPISRSIQTPHPDVSTDAIEQLKAFDALADDYWAWQFQLDQLKQTANSLFVDRIETDIIQPACSVCHRLQDEEMPRPFGILSFYGHTKSQHGELNGSIAFDFLLREEDPNVLMNRALGGNNHGGGQVLPAGSSYADSLQDHANVVDQYLNLLAQPPL